MILRPLFSFFSIVIFLILFFACKSIVDKNYLFNNISLELRDSEYFKKIDAYSFKRYATLNPNKKCLPPLNKYICHDFDYELFIGIPNVAQDSCLIKDISKSSIEIEGKKVEFYQKIKSDSTIIIETVIKIDKNKFYVLASTKSDSIANLQLDAKSILARFIKN